MFNSLGEFNQAFDEYVGNRGRRPLTLDTFDCFIKLCAVFGRAIADYTLFTLARSQCRVPKPSTPEASRIRYQFTDYHLDTPDKQETSRIWRGILLYELVCLLHGVPQVMAAALDQSHHAPEGLEDTDISLREVPTNVREEAMCIQKYVQEQYELSFNELVESFELAVRGVAQQPLETSPPLAGGITPIIVDLPWESFQETVEYLVRPPFNFSNSWTTNMAVLGINFLQEFLSWDASSRLDFIRITYPFLGNWAQYAISNFLTFDIDLDDLLAKNLGWSDDYIRYWAWDLAVEDDIQHRLRAVGWIFWSDLDRLSFMNLIEGEVDDSYGCRSELYNHLRLQGRPNLLETLVDIQKWEPIVQYFGPRFSEHQLNHIQGLFKSMGDLNSGRVADVVSSLRCHDEEDAPHEAPEKVD